MKKARMVNGYRVIYMPDYPGSMGSDNWDGWIYEHRFIAEKSLGRPLKENEVVHHLDGDRANNRVENLLVLESGQHTKLHNWLHSIGDSAAKAVDENGVNSGKSKEREQRVCRVCGIQLQGKQKKVCSLECRRIYQRKVNWPNAKQLQDDINNMSWLAIGRKYGVSDNAARKWARIYGIL